MTRLLIVSDTHGEVMRLEDLLRKYRGQYDILVHLGDRLFDMYSVQENVEKRILVRGNMEVELSEGQDLGVSDVFVELDGVKVLATHGHRYSVHSTLVFLKREALRRGAGLVLYGHTHERDLFIEDDIMYFNPGSLKNSDYGLITLDGGEVVNIEQGYLSDRG